MRILSVFAHVDDLLIWAFGTIYKASFEDGAKIQHLILGDYEKKQRNNIDLYERFGITTECLKPEKLGEQVLNLNPDKILTHWVLDSNKEHREVFDLVSKAALKQRIVHGKGELYSTSTYNGLGLDNIEFSPTLLVDVSDYWSFKKKAILSLKNEPVQMWLDMARKQNEYYGSRIKVKYAESFRKVNVNGVFDSGDSF